MEPVREMRNKLGIGVELRIHKGKKQDGRLQPGSSTEDRLGSLDHLLLPVRSTSTGLLLVDRLRGIATVSVAGRDPVRGLPGGGRVIVPEGLVLLERKSTSLLDEL
jgi:hypothetical protein